MRLGLSEDPRVLQQLVRGHPSARLHHQKRLNNVDSLMGDVFPGRRREVKLSLLDLLEQFHVVLIVKRREAAQSKQVKKVLVLTKYRGLLQCSSSRTLCRRVATQGFQVRHIRGSRMLLWLESRG